MIRDYLHYLIWVICCTLWAALCFIAPDFIDNPVHDLPTLMTIVAYIVVLAGATFWVLYLFGLNRYVAWVALPVFALGGAAVSFFRVAFHATITPMIIDATLHTNGGTVAGVVSWQLVGWLLLNVVIALAFAYWRSRMVGCRRAWLHALVVAALLMAYYNANSRLHQSINQRYPYNIVHNFAEYLKQQQQLSAERTALPYEVVAMPDSLNVVFVLGEAVRADHLGLNGYERQTTPLLSERSNVVSLKNIYSEHTYTSTSVPHILSPADSIHPEWIATHHSFIHTFSSNGYVSSWISNQDNGRTYVSFINESDTVIFPNANKSVFVFDPWYDEQLLPAFDRSLQRAGARKLTILHCIGSHWYYNLHVPPQMQVYEPSTDNRIVTNNSEQQVINAYDNTVLYMDMMLDSIIQRLEHSCAVLIYLSDHGEALGEEGIFLHAAEHDVLHRPACVIWYSDAYAAMFPDKVEALNANKDKPYRTDFLYPSILSAAGIRAEGSNADVDVFSTTDR